MSSSTSKKTAGVFVGFYWIGIVMTLACLALVVASNTELLYQPEHSRFPLSWMCGGMAVLAFLAAEVFGRPSSPAVEPELEIPQPASEWEAAEV